MQVHFIDTGGGLVATSCSPLVALWTVARETPLSVGLSSQECWRGVPFPSLVHLPNPGTEPGSPALQVDFLLTEPVEKASLILKSKFLFWSSFSIANPISTPNCLRNE